MSTRQTWAYEMAARCRRVGWPVEQVNSRSGGHFKVRCPDETIVQLHLSPSDVNAAKNVERILVGKGLAKAEAAFERKQARERKERLAADKAKASAAAKKVTARTTAVARAAGPYAVLEEPDISWYLKAHPAPWVRWCLISPEYARTILDKANTHNRKLKPARSDRYKRIIISGQWHSTHQGIAFDTNGVLQDGQHRLEAIASSGVAAPLFVFVGMPVENFKHIDEGLLRQADQLLTMEGEANAVTLSSAIRLANIYVSPNPRVSAKIKATNSDIFDAFAADSDELREAVLYARKHYRAVGCNPGVLAAARYLLRRLNGTANPYVEAFFDGVATGAKSGTRLVLDDDDPRRKLRNWFDNRRSLRQRIDAVDQLAIIVKAWNYLISDNRMQYLRVAREMQVPAISVCRPDGPNASAPPPLIADEV